MKLSPWNLEHHTITKAQLPAEGVLTYLRPIHIHSSHPHLFYTSWEPRSGETFLPSLQDTAREDTILLAWHRGNSLNFCIHEKRNPQVGTVVIWVAQSTHPANPTQQRCPSRTWVGSMRSQSNNDCIYEHTPILWLSATAVPPPLGSRMVQTRRYCVHPRATGTAQTCEVSSNTAQALSKRSQATKLIEQDYKSLEIMGQKSTAHAWHLWSRCRPAQLETSCAHSAQTWCRDTRLVHSITSCHSKARMPNCYCIGWIPRCSSYANNA